MKILLAIDGSGCSHAAIEEIAGRPWPKGARVRILFVCAPFPYVALFDPLFVDNAVAFDRLNRERASYDADEAAREIRESNPGIGVEVEVLQGPPRKMIVEEADRWGADLIVVGAHGDGPIHRFLLGSVAQAVVSHAGCSVEIVR